ncbi:MAG: PadR family transcriptional regulator [Chitinophagaceae bacterium]|jgi:DNA-binding PadR family transcriptional regulator|nr:PadR family transcriptional regulator [Chitinophagaceae bacterium]
MRPSALLKGCLEPIVLQMLKEHGRMYGYQLTQQVKELTKGELSITEGALYPLLHRLEAAGVLETTVEQMDNRMRKYYSLTRSGKKQAELSQHALTTFIENLQSIFHQPKTAS